MSSVGMAYHRDNISVENIIADDIASPNRISRDVMKYIFVGILPKRDNFIRVNCSTVLNRTFF